MEKRYINLIRSIVECPVNFSVDCLQGLQKSDDPDDQIAYREAVEFLAKLSDKLERVLQLSRPIERSPADYPDPFTP